MHCPCWSGPCCSSARSCWCGSRAGKAAELMSTFPWLTVAGAVPLVGAIAIALTPGRTAPGSPADRRARDQLVKQIALVFSLITLAVTIVIAVKFKAGGPRFQFQQVYQWIPQFGVHYAVGVDGIALVLILMS